jgi:hypothetical protein
MAALDHAEVEARAIAAAKEAGDSPAGFAETHAPDNGELHNRMQSLEMRARTFEAFMWHLSQTVLRNVNLEQIVEDYEEFRHAQNNPDMVLNPNLRGPDGPLLKR